MSYSDYRRIARENLAGNWGQSILVAFVAALFGALLTGASFSINIDASILSKLPMFIQRYVALMAKIAGILGIVRFVAGGTVQLGYTQYLLKQYNKASFDIKDLFSEFHRFTQGFLQNFLRGLYVFLWSLLFVIPGLVKTYSYAMTPFIMAENPDMTANEAITASRELMDGHKGELFCLELTFFGWMLLNALTLGLGSLALNPYMNAARAAFYKDLTAPHVQNAEFYNN